MTFDFISIRRSLESLRTGSLKYFDAIHYVGDGSNHFIQLDDPDLYWSALEEYDQQASVDLQSELLRVVQQIANCLKQSSLASEADRRDLSSWTKSMRASLRLRQYDSWETEVLHDEGTILGIRASGQSDSNPTRPAKARRHFERDVSNLLNLVDLLEASPSLSFDEIRLNPQVTTEYKPNSAFVMMQIDPDNPLLEDVYATIKECCTRFEIVALRADEIEHEEIITDRILNEIKCSEFLLADLTGERPSVYYEIGYAHSLGRRVIMYRHGGTRVHFDLAAYNCPEYKNQKSLREQLMRRLETITNRKPKDLQTQHH